MKRGEVHRCHHEGAYPTWLRSGVASSAFVGIDRRLVADSAIKSQMAARIRSFPIHPKCMAFPDLMLFRLIGVFASI